MENYLETLEVTLPDTSKVTIRLQNGNDEDILSRVGDAQKSTNIAKYLSSIIVEPKLSWEDINKWKVSNKYYLLVASRVFNFGAEFMFNQEIEYNGSKLTQNFTEDLSKFLVNFDDPENIEKVTKENPLVCKPYKLENASFREFTLSNGRKVKYDLLTGEGELKISKIKQEDIRINDVLRARNLSVFNNDKNTYEIVSDYGTLSSKELLEIRKDVQEYDYQYGMEMELELPDGNKMQVSMIQYPEFFFPQF